jgi:hypothetical protein
MTIAKNTLLITLVLFYFLGGCATTLDGPTQKVIIHCTPDEGVMVTADGKLVPYKDGWLELDKKRDVHFVTLAKEGYYESTLALNHQVDVFWPIADLVFGPAYPVALFVDWQLGSLYKIYPGNVNVVMRKKE